jgi:hypothetical protein
MEAPETGVLILVGFDPDCRNAQALSQQRLGFAPKTLDALD